MSNERNRFHSLQEIQSVYFPSYFNEQTSAPDSQSRTNTLAAEVIEHFRREIQSLSGAVMAGKSTAKKRVAKKAAKKRG